jgi:hypothetical protein
MLTCEVIYIYATANQPIQRQYKNAAGATLVPLIGLQKC